MAMALGFRQLAILDLARETGQLHVEDLAARFGVTLQTVRRDLNDLADSGHLERVHGGAVLKAPQTALGYRERVALNAAAKDAIGRACAAAIPDGATLVLNIGTTTEAAARALLGHKGLTVVTNNMNVANILAANEDCQIMLAGGALRRSDGGLVGDLATAFISQFKPDIAVIGTSALDLDGDLLDYDLAEVTVSRAIIAAARRVYLVTDHTKIGRSAPARIGSLSEVDALFTDKPLPETLARACAFWGCAVELA
jgi:DeoR family glycerol-3-phosphate regulon repressor